MLLPHQKHNDFLKAEVQKEKELLKETKTQFQAIKYQSPIFLLSYMIYIFIITEGNMIDCAI